MSKSGQRLVASQDCVCSWEARVSSLLLVTHGLQAITLGFRKEARFSSVSSCCGGQRSQACNPTPSTATKERQDRGEAEGRDCPCPLTPQISSHSTSHHYAEFPALTLANFSLPSLAKVRRPFLPWIKEA